MQSVGTLVSYIEALYIHGFLGSEILDRAPTFLDLGARLAENIKFEPCSIGYVDTIYAM